MIVRERVRKKGRKVGRKEGRKKERWGSFSPRNNRSCCSSTHSCLAMLTMSFSCPTSLTIDKRTTIGIWGDVMELIERIEYIANNTVIQSACSYLSIHSCCIKTWLLAHHPSHLHLHHSIRFVHLGRFSQYQ